MTMYFYIVIIVEQISHAQYHGLSRGIISFRLSPW